MTDALTGAVDLDCLDAVSHLVVQRGSSVDLMPRSGLPSTVVQSARLEVFLLRIPFSCSSVVTRVTGSGEAWGSRWPCK